MSGDGRGQAGEEVRIKRKGSNLSLRVSGGVM
jgi:hypothetical protein